MKSHANKILESIKQALTEHYQKVARLCCLVLKRVGMHGLILIGIF